MILKYESHITSGSQIIKEFTRIQNTLKQIKGIINVYLKAKSGVADLTAFANWKGSILNEFSYNDSAKHNFAN